MNILFPNLVKSLIVIVAVCGTVLAVGCEPAAHNLAEIGPAPRPITPPTQAEIRQAIDRGVAFLVSHQQPPGHWGTIGFVQNIGLPSQRDTESFKMATTALCVKALIETRSESPEAIAALARGEQWLLTNVPRFKRQDLKSLFNNWGHLYAIEAMVAMLNHRPMTDERRTELRRLVDQQIRLLAAGRTLRGGWGYYTFPPHTRPSGNWATSFLTSAAMIAYHDAEQAGFDIPRAASATGLMALRWARFPNGAFGYTIYTIATPGSLSNYPQGAVARSQAGNLALYLYGDKRTTPEVIKNWLNRLIIYDRWLAVPLKKLKTHHYRLFAIAGYYYYYAYYYAARAIEQLDPADRPQFQNHLAEILIRRQDKDGSWWDFVLFGYQKGYGTAMGLMALQRCLQPPADQVAP
ncbi:hypothetical protein LCGC14_0239020 [marine sediment metagenome]|uniref:Squalene cyclase C-terminal domain-containing protein n=1 Tax=marine sediment metagenome TaxID=412755 RepID=A0A0F9U847_9ZZZZ|nr:hypothetical protein [Phycisphaerae bacterium]HDZ44114.1 hypothetical protein [Phycisphaerae bacterium]